MMTGWLLDPAAFAKAHAFDAPVTYIATGF
jgi:hypothetical protein